MKWWDGGAREVERMTGDGGVVWPKGGRESKSKRVEENRTKEGEKSTKTTTGTQKGK